MLVPIWKCLSLRLFSNNQQLDKKLHWLDSKKLKSPSKLLKDDLKVRCRKRTRILISFIDSHPLRYYLGEWPFLWISLIGKPIIIGSLPSSSSGFSVISGAWTWVSWASSRCWWQTLHGTSTWSCHTGPWAMTRWEGCPSLTCRSVSWDQKGKTSGLFQTLRKV